MMLFSQLVFLMWIKAKNFPPLDQNANLYHMFTVLCRTKLCARDWLCGAWREAQCFCFTGPFLVRLQFCHDRDGIINNESSIMKSNGFIKLCQVVHKWRNSPVAAHVGEEEFDLTASKPFLPAFFQREESDYTLKRYIVTNCGCTW